MAIKTSAAFALVAAVVVNDHGLTFGGSGPYKSYSFEVESLANHTFYQPLESAAGSDLKLPVIVWGNGACIPFGMSIRSILGEMASHGALVIATGSMYVDPETYVPLPDDPSGGATRQNPAALRASINWVQANAGNGDWKHVDASRVGPWGQSCGGLEAYTTGMNDSRVSHLGIPDSGQLDEVASKAVAGSLKKPIFYTVGGPTDVAFESRDYHFVPAGTPAWKANHDLGHSVALDVPNAGITGTVGAHSIKWVLGGDESAKAWLTGDAPMSIGVKDVVSKDLYSIKVTPIQ